MTNPVFEKYIADGLQELSRMETAGRRGNAVSLELLMRLIRKNEDTEYGKKYGFNKISSYADFAKQVPLSGYEDYEPYIERMLSFGQKNLITADDVVYYAHTSGTSGAPKMIPCTKEALDILFSAVFERVFGLYDAACREKTGKVSPSSGRKVPVSLRASGFTDTHLA